MMFEPDTFNNFIRVVEHLLAEEEQMISFRRSLVGTALDVPKLFNVLSRGADACGPVDLQGLLEEHGHKYNIDNLDISLFIHAFDLDGDGQISR